MEILPIFIIVLVAATLALSLGGGAYQKTRHTKSRKVTYQYRAKRSIMTSREQECFRRLDAIFGKKYYVAPQVHLSTLFDHKIQRQNWKGAFSHINGKSVDFLLVDKVNFAPICAMELDDSSHDAADRQARDLEVERIFRQTNFPLVRLRRVNNMTDREILEAFKTAVRETRTNQ